MLEDKNNSPDRLYYKTNLIIFYLAFCVFMTVTPLTVRYYSGGNNSNIFDGPIYLVMLIIASVISFAFCVLISRFAYIAASGGPALILGSDYIIVCKFKTVVVPCGDIGILKADKAGNLVIGRIEGPDVMLPFKLYRGDWDFDRIKKLIASNCARDA
jgi:hypothetical protein